MLKNNNNQKYIKARQYLTAQQYIEAEYPTNFIQQNIRKLDISNLDLKGTLDLSNFSKLEELNCANNLLTHLDLSGCDKLKKINGDGNNNLKVVWNKKVENQARYSTLGLQEPLSVEEIRIARTKKQRRQGGLISGEYLWTTIHSGFDFETIQSWKDLGFSYEEANDWIKAGFYPWDLEICVWLRDVKKSRIEQIDRTKIGELRQEFINWQQEGIRAEIEMNNYS